MVLKDCSRGCVYTTKGQRMAEARVVHTKDSVSLFFARYDLQDARFKGRVDFYDDRVGLVVTFCEILIRRNPSFPDVPEPWMAECRILEVKKVVQRQGDVRMKVQLEVEFSSKTHGNFYGTIKNISAGGLYLTTSQALIQHEHITFKYQFKAIERPFEVLVLWGKRDGGKYGYGGRFLNLTNGGEAAIRYYVYKKQMEREKYRE